MNNNQRQVLDNAIWENDVEGQKRLKEIWNNPRIIPIDKKRSMMVSVFAGKDNGIWIWNCSIRIFKHRSPMCKPTLLWMEKEKEVVSDQLGLELFGVGKEDTMKVEAMPFYIYCIKELTDEEIQYLNGKTRITTVEETNGKGI